jgi:hypothetical protein
MRVKQPWPSDSELDVLVQKASGSFIFASTLINFIEESCLPHKELSLVLESHTGLDVLYTQVLSTVPRGGTSDRVVGTIMLLKSPLSITSLGYLLCLDSTNILLVLLRIQSILMIPVDDNEPVRLFHTSLRDFMTTKSRSKDFCVDPPVVHFIIATGCLKVLTVRPKDIIFDGELEVYACRNWCYHFLEGLREVEYNLVDSSLGGCPMSCLTQLLAEFSFDYWVNTLILHSNMETILDILNSELPTSRVSVVFHLLCILPG